MSIQKITVLSMGRPRKEMTALVNGRMRTRIHEHLWKVFAYHSLGSPKAPVPHWLDELNAWLDRLQTVNVQKDSPNGKNYSIAELHDKFVVELFEDDDIEVLNAQWSNKGYPYVPMSAKDCDKMRALAYKFCKCIHDITKFSVTTSELL